MKTYFAMPPRDVVDPVALDRPSKARAEVQ